MTVRWTGEAVADGTVAFRVGREDASVVAEWTGLATLRSDLEGTSFSFETHPALEPALVDKLRRGTVPALLRHLRGEPSLHASAVEIGGRAVAFLGPPSAGKSTLAAYLSRSWPLVADDILLLDLGEGVRALPNASVSWLTREACDSLGCSGDGPVPAPRVRREALPLGALLLLVYGPGHAVTRLRGMAALSALLGAQIRFVVDDPATHARDVAQMQRVAELVPVYELVRPRGLAELEETVRRLGALMSPAPAAVAGGR